VLTHEQAATATLHSSGPSRLLSPWPTALVLVLTSLALRLPFLTASQIDYDEGVYWESLRALSAGHALFTSVYSSQPPAFLHVISAFYTILGQSLAAARAGVVVQSLTGIVATYQVARLAFGPKAGLVAGALLAIDPLYLRQSVALEADGPCVAIGMVAIALAATAGGRESRLASSERALAGAALALAVLTKILAVAFLVPVVVVLLMPFEGTARPPVSRRQVRAAAIRLLETAVGVVIAMSVILAPYLNQWDALWSQSVGMHLVARGLSMGGLTGDLIGTLMGEAPLLPAAVVGLAIAAWRTRTGALFMLSWAMAVGALLFLQRPLWPHHVVLMTPLLATAAAPAVASLESLRPNLPRTIALAFVVVIALGWAFMGAAALERSGASQLAAAEVLGEVTRPTDLVVTDDQFAAALADRDTPPELVDTSFVRVESEPLTAPELEGFIERDHVAAVYFATGRLDQVPGLRTWVAAHFARRVNLEGGGTLFVR
jgi:4-amino-4-deoxy-L-arabinose transferase-like glycosyltransferase